MAFTYDDFIAEMTCPVCGYVTSLDDSLEMQTYLREESNAANLGVGSHLHIDLDDIRNNAADSCYTLNLPRAGEPIRLLTSWNCPNCGSYNWAEVEITDDIITSIANTPLDRTAVTRGHLISNEADYVAADLQGVTLDQFSDTDTVRVLKEKL